MSNSHTRPRSRRRAALLIGGLSRLPLALLYAISDLLFLVLYRVLRFQRRLVIDNIGRAFPTASRQEIERLSAHTYRHALDLLFETIKAWRLNQRDFRQRVQIENADMLSDLLAANKIVLALTSHCGNWEWLQLACAVQLDQRIAAVYSPLNHTGVDALLLDMRARFGSTLIDTGRALPELIRFARDGGIIALNADQGPRPEDDKYWTDFLGIETAFFTGPEKLARLFRAPVVFVAMRRLRRGRFSVRFELLATPPYAAGDAVMPAYVSALEAQIRAAPQDWFWLYKRWKYRKPLYADQPSM
jgi:KDO2-lipid IV(A) lauroyltransferase